MKKIFLTTAIAALFTANLFAANRVIKNDDGTENVSYKAVNKFRSNFSDAKNVTWTVTANTQKATFILDDVKMTAFYNIQGEYLGTTEYVEYKTIPSRAKKEIAAKYNDFTISEVIKLNTDGSDTTGEPTAYFVDMKKGTTEFLLRVTPSANVYFFQQVK